MRSSLLPGLIDAVRRARRRGEARARLFSVGACFGAPVASSSAGARPRLAEDVGTLPEERPMFGALLSGPRNEYLALKADDVDVYDVKGIALEIVERLSGRDAAVKFLGATERTRHLHPRGAAEVSVDGTPLGHFGPLHPEVVEAFDLGGPAELVEIDLAALEALGRRTPKYRPIPRLPAVTRDLSLVVAEPVLAGAVQNLLASQGGELCESVELVGLFRGGSVAPGSKSLTFRVVCRDPRASAGAEDARTLTDKEVEAALARMLAAVQKELGATLRA
jgi:phenylalanyl-tRNA synthetase beta chain